MVWHTFLASVALSVALSSCVHGPLREPQSSLENNRIIPACIEYSSKVTFSKTQSKDSRFGECGAEGGFPTRGAIAKAAHPEVVASAFNAMTECLEISNPKKLTALFSGESGYYSNAYGGAGELGVGQLSKNAIADVSAALPVLQDQWSHSSNPSCRQLSAQGELWKKLSYSQGCEFMNGNVGVQRNLLYALTYHKLIEKWIDSDLEVFQIESSLKSLGLQASSGAMQETPSWELAPTVYHRRDLRGLLSSVSYNAGARGVVSYLKDYLNKRLQSQVAITKADFNFKQDLSYLNALSKEQLLSTPIQQISFPAYLKIYQRWGHPGYGPDMMRLIYRFNESVGPHVCTPERIEGFLAL